MKDRSTNPSATIEGPGIGHSAEQCGLRYYARQAILDMHGAVYAYELLFRSGPEGEFRGNGDHATRTMLDNTLMFGLERLTGGLPAFVNCTLDALAGGLVEVLPPNLTVLEILETLEPTPELIAACRKLKDRGFRLALDDFIWKPELALLVDLADCIKVDFMQSDRRAREALMQRVRGRRIELLAEKVETREEFEQARDEGFTLFQGYYFCRPMLMEKSEIPANALTQLELLRNLQAGSFDLPKICELVERDAAITYRLLRLSNSARYAFRQEVCTVQTALVVVGEKAFRRLATLAIAGELNANGPAEVLHMALVRARFCELAAGYTTFDAAEQYLLGMFSLLPAMLRIPMDQAISALAFRDKIRAALMGEKIPERSLLCWMEASERQDWSMCDTIQAFHGVDDRQLAQCAAEAVEWAEEILHATSIR